MNIHLISLTIFSAFVHGEQMLSRDEACRVLIDSHDRAAMLSRNYIGGQSNRWPSGVVPYTMSSSFSALQKDTIMNSMKHISDKTCIRFVERTDEANYLDIFTGESGCYANLGYSSSRTRSVLHLQSNGCLHLDIVVHELLHILGFGHEQTRSDRDEYIQINWDNIQSGTYSNFWKAVGENEEVTVPYCGNVGIDQYDNCHAGFRASTFGIGYDYGSIMHYGLDFFTNNGQNTMTVKKQTTVQIPNIYGMSDLDVQKTRAAYECQSVVNTTQEQMTTSVKTETPTTRLPASSTLVRKTSTVKPETTSRMTDASTMEPEPTTKMPSTIRPDTTITTDCKDTWQNCMSYTHLCGINDFINQRCKKTCFNCECFNIIAVESCETMKAYCGTKEIKKFCRNTCKQC